MILNLMLLVKYLSFIVLILNKNKIMPIAYPYKWSDWYGYDKDCSPSLTSFSSSKRATSAIFACNFTSLNLTFYHDGSNALPSPGDLVYTANNAIPANFLSSGYYKIQLSPGRYMYIDPVGEVDIVGFCL